MEYEMTWWQWPIVNPELGMIKESGDFENNYLKNDVDSVKPEVFFENFWN